MRQVVTPTLAVLWLYLSSCGGSSSVASRHLAVELLAGRAQTINDPLWRLSLSIAGEDVVRSAKLSVTFGEDWSVKPRGERNLSLATLAVVQSENLPSRFQVAWPTFPNTTQTIGVWSTDGVNWLPEAAELGEAYSTYSVDLSSQSGQIRSGQTRLYLGIVRVPAVNRQPSLKVLSGFGPDGVLDSNQEAVVMVHGMLSSAQAMKPLADALVPEGFQVAYGWQYDWTQSIEQNGRLLSELLSGLPPGKKVSLVGHSMGTVVCRSAIEQFGAGRQVNLLVGLAGPSQGSPLAKTADLCRSQWWNLINSPSTDSDSWFGACSPSTVSVTQLKPGSDFLNSLNQRNSQLNRVPYLVIAGNDFNWGGPLGALLKYLYFPGVESDGIVSVDSVSGQDFRNQTHGVTKSVQLHQDHFQLLSDPAAASLIRAFIKELDRHSGISLSLEVENQGRAGEFGWDCRLRLANDASQELTVDRVISLIYDRDGEWVATQWMVLLGLLGFFPDLPTDFNGPDGLQLGGGREEYLEFFTWFDADQVDYEHSNSNQHALSLIIIAQGRTADGEKFRVSLSQTLLDQDGSGPTVLVRSPKSTQPKLGRTSRRSPRISSRNK